MTPRRPIYMCKNSRTLPIYQLLDLPCRSCYSAMADDPDARTKACRKAPTPSQYRANFCPHPIRAGKEGRIRELDVLFSNSVFFFRAILKTNTFAAYSEQVYVNLAFYPGLSKRRQNRRRGKMSTQFAATLHRKPLLSLLLIQRRMP